MSEEELREQYNQGYNDGYAEGRSEGEAETRDKIIREVLNLIEDTRRTVLDSLEELRYQVEKMW